MPDSRARGLSALLLGSVPTDALEFDANSQSCLAETVKILAGAYAGALGAVLGGMVMISVPSVRDHAAGGFARALSGEGRESVRALHRDVVRGW